MVLAIELSRIEVRMFEYIKGKLGLPVVRFVIINYAIETVLTNQHRPFSMRLSPDDYLLHRPPML